MGAWTLAMCTAVVTALYIVTLQKASHLHTMFFYSRAPTQSNSELTQAIGPWMAMSQIPIETERRILYLCDHKFCSIAYLFETGAKGGGSHAIAAKHVETLIPSYKYKSPAQQLGFCFAQEPDERGSDSARNKSRFPGTINLDLCFKQTYEVGRLDSAKTNPDLRATYIWTYACTKNVRFGVGFCKKAIPDFQAPFIWTYALHTYVRSGIGVGKQQFQISGHRLSGLLFAQEPEVGCRLQQQNQVQIPGTI